jgi:thiamine biosynthesis lipoprotein
MKTPNTVIDQKRRSFLKLSGLLGLGAASAALMPAEKAEAFLFGPKEYKVARTRLAMGTFVAMTAIHPSRDEAEHAIGLAFAEMDRLSELLTHYHDRSAVGTFNRDGKLADIPVEMQELLGRSMYFNKLTGGTFDVTVKPLIDLYKNSFAAGKIPSDVEIDKTLPLVGANKLRFANNTVSFGQEHMGITLDGIAKGYIVDRISDVLRTNGVTNHLINAGGDIRTHGSAERGKAWTVAVQDPKKTSHYPDILQMRDGAIATSGDYEIYYDQEKLFHHIVDSKTGHSPHLLSSVTVTAPCVMDADALATSLIIMPEQDGLALINRHAEYDCFIIDHQGKIAKSNGWQA